MKKFTSIKHAVSMIAASGLMMVAVLATTVSPQSWLLVYSEDAPEELLK